MSESEPVNDKTWTNRFSDFHLPKPKLLGNVTFQVRALVDGVPKDVEVTSSSWNKGDVEDKAKAKLKHEHPDADTIQIVMVEG